MIPINKEFAIDRYREGWCLMQRIPKQDADGYTIKKSHYPHFSNCVDEIIERAPQNCSSMKQVAKNIMEVKTQLHKAIKKAGLE